MRLSIFILVLAAMVSPIFASGSAAADSHPFCAKDLVTLKRMYDPQLSPDSTRIVFVLRETDMEANRGRTDLWLVNSNGSNLRRLTTHPAADFNPRWSADGSKVWFLSTRSGSSQVWSIPYNGGEAVQKTKLPLNVGNLVIAPDGETIAFSMEVFPHLTHFKETKAKLDNLARSKVTGRIFDKLFIRHWDTWKDGRRSHIFIMNLKNGRILDVMKGMDADSPSKPFGGPEEITFSPDSQELIFTARAVGRREAWSTNFDLFRVPVNGSDKPQNLTEDNKAWDTLPVFSPDGKYLAYLAMTRPDFESDQYQLILQSWPKGEKRVLTKQWDHSPGSITWAPDGKTIYMTAANLGQRSLFAINIKNKRVRTILKDGTVRAVMVSRKDIYYTRDNLASPVDLFVISRRGKRSKRLTRINQKQLDLIRFGTSEQFTFNGWNNEKVYCYVVKPVDFDPQKRYPVAFLIHGGPQGSFGNDFHYRWNPQTYTGAGYAVVMVDFHGSVGYGQAFTDSIRGDWGGKPLEDLKKGLAAALKRYPWMDPKRVAALGASYGGFMINWIAGNWPDRFTCLVNHDGNLDERIAYYDTEELWFPEWEHGGPQWKNPQGYEKHNPINYIKNWKTPMLVIHGAHDFRVVETQGFSTFTALQRKGIPSKLLYFPDENHWVLKPHNSLFWHKTVIQWLNQWTGKE